MNLTGSIYKILYANGHNHKITHNKKQSTFVFSKAPKRYYKKLYGVSRLFDTSLTNDIIKIFDKKLRSYDLNVPIKCGRAKFKLNISHHFDDISYYYEITNTSLVCNYVASFVDDTIEVNICNMSEEEKFELLLLQPNFVLEFMSDGFVEKVRKLAKKNTCYYIEINGSQY